MKDISHCKIIHIKREASDKGSLSVLESEESIPFDIKRIYYTYDIPSNALRGGHSHIKQHEVVIAVSGSFEIVLDNGKEKESIFLNNPAKGLHIIPGIWRELRNFSTGSVVLVFASDVYTEDDYIRNYNKFLETI